MKYLQIFLLFFCCGFISAQKLRICGYPAHQGVLCKSANSGTGSTKLQCTKVQDSVDCALQIKEGSADFGAFYPEQALLVSKFINDKAAVIGEIRHKNVELNKDSYKTVVVVRSDHSEGLKGMKGKSYCHFGFDTETAISLRAKQEFENALVNIEGKCTSDKTLTERQIEIFASIFSRGCRPGSWTEDDKLDKQLKSKYYKLCELCDNQNECSYSNNEDSSKNPLRCLTEKNAQVAYTTATATELYFKEKPDKRKEYRLLCRNGETKELTETINDDCTWRNQPWTIIMGKMEKAEAIQTSLKEWIEPNYIINLPATRKVHSDEYWKIALRQILTNWDNDKKIYFPESTKSPSEYFQENKQELTEVKQNTQCQMKWCTINGWELEKCQWLSEAAEQFGIQPRISCIPESSTLQCLKNMRDDKSDVMVIDSHYGYIARKGAWSRSLLLFEENAEDVSQIFTVLRADSVINSFSDLKGKKACFPEYRGIAWLAFIQFGREQKELEDNCDFGKVVGNYFSETCAPGVDDMHYRSAGADSRKLCSLCVKTSGEKGYCGADGANKYYDNNGSMKCLEESAADVAFVDLSDIQAGSVDLSNMKILCKDGSIVDQIDLGNLRENCAITQVVNSEVIAKSTNNGYGDFKEALLKMDSKFGELSMEDDTINMYASFRGQKDVLFKSASTSMVDENSRNELIQNYRKLFEFLEVCFAPTTTPAPTTIATRTTTDSSSILSGFNSFIIISTVAVLFSWLL